MVLYTSEVSDNGVDYAQNAEFDRYENLAELKRAVIESPAAGHKEGDLIVVDVEDAGQPDAWIRTYSEPTEFEKMQWTQEVGELLILEPGSHPGMGYCIFPRAVVYTPVYEELPEKLRKNYEDIVAGGAKFTGIRIIEDSEGYMLWHFDHSLLTHGSKIQDCEKVNRLDSKWLEDAEEEAANLLGADRLIESRSMPF